MFLGKFYNILLIKLKKIDWVLLSIVLIISTISLSLIYNPWGNQLLFQKQVISLSISLFFFFLASNINIQFFKYSNFVVLLYFITIFLLVFVIFAGYVSSGAKSWIDLIGSFAFQPTDLSKIALVLVLSKYFFKRHVEIFRIKHLIISSLYMLILFALLMVQPDLGSAMIVFFIWFLFVFIIGIPKKFIVSLFLGGAIIVFLGYSFILHDYQKDRINIFFNPYIDPLGRGYNIIQSNIALGSGQLTGVGFFNGTQSRYGFLPQANTDFIFSFFGEEWGFIGVFLLFLLYFIFFVRILFIIRRGRTNFEVLFGLGILIYFLSHFIVHVGINLSLLPVTGTTMPFMSYGGSHLIIEFIALGILNSIFSNSKKFLKQDLEDTYILG